MLYEEERELRTAMHEAREKSGVAKYVPERRNIKPIAEDMIDERNSAVYGSRAIWNLDENLGVAPYSDIRDWVENVVDGFNKGMQFDGRVDKKRNVHRAVSMFLKPAKGYPLYLNGSSLKQLNILKACYAGR